MARRPRSPWVLAVRFAGHLPYFKFASALLLPEALSLPAAAAIAFTYSVACHEIGSELAARHMAASDVLAPLKASCLLMAVMLLCVPAVTLLLSPATYGPEPVPLSLVPPLMLLLLPCCLAFAVAQWHARSHRQLLFRLGLMAVTRRTPARRGGAPHPS